jgi:cytochrome c biogenesis protein CcmG, thiol:disulfide interchange protein DsbE
VGVRIPEPLRKSLPYLGVAVGVVFYVAVTFGGGLGYSSEHRALPKLEARTLGSGAVVTDTSLRGKPAIINVWAPDCFPCTRELPNLDRLAERYQGRVNVLALTAWGSPEAASALAASKHLTHMPLLTGGETFLQDLGVESVPTTFFVDASGQIVGRQVGIRSEGFFRAQAEKLLVGSGISPGAAPPDPAGSRE